MNIKRVVALTLAGLLFAGCAASLPPDRAIPSMGTETLSESPLPLFTPPCPGTPTSEMTPEEVVKVEANELLERYEAGERNFQGIDLSGVELPEVELSGIDLSGANLTEVDLSTAKLGSANLSGADLTGANLSGAILNRANLSQAILQQANLSWADLFEANLTGADLSGADMTMAIIIRTRFKGATMPDGTQRP